MTKNDVCEMIDGIPIWLHLKNNSMQGIDAEITKGDNGKIAERIGTRILSIKIFKEKSLIKYFFPSIDVLSLKKLHEDGDYMVEVNCKDSVGYHKKILLFEIKSGHVDISQRQINKYSSMLLCPDKHFAKADEIKIVYMVFDFIDTINQKVHYYFSVLEPYLAKRILEQNDARE